MPHLRESQIFENSRQSFHQLGYEQRKMDENVSKCFQQIKILVVEDNEINIKIIKLYLNECGIKEIIIAKNGKQALELFSDTFDLVILDIGLPDISGIEVCKQMRMIRDIKYIPIVACTANGDIRNECKDAGMDDYLMKPLTIKDLKTMLQNNLKTYSVPSN